MKNKKYYFYIIVGALLTLIIFWTIQSYQAKSYYIDELEKSNQLLNDSIKGRYEKIVEYEKIIDEQKKTIEQEEKSIDSLKSIRNELEKSIDDCVIHSSSFSEASQRLREYLKTEKQQK